MGYVSVERLRLALERLPAYHAFYGVSLLCMKQDGVPVLSQADVESKDKSKLVEWSSAEETKFLDKYYRPPGAPPGKQYFVPFGREDATTGNWKDRRYSSTTLQRARTTDRQRAAFVHPTNTSEWAFTPDYISVLSNALSGGSGNSSSSSRIPVLDLAAWLFRDEELPNELNAIVEHFRTTFKLDGAVWNDLFDPAVSEDPSEFFAAQKLTDEQLVELTKGVPIGPTLGSVTEAGLVESLEKHIREEGRLKLPDHFVRRVYRALKAQRFVVLAGRPGTGKTAFARAYAEALKDVFPGAVSYVQVSVGQEQGDSDTFGYENLAGALVPTALTHQLFLSGRQRDIYVVVLDEMNLAHVDYYLSRVLPAIESGEPVRLPGRATEKFSLPADAMFIGTVNSFVQEPTREPLSAPVKRRAHVIEIPDALDQVLEGGDSNESGSVPVEFRSFVRTLLAQSLRSAERRQSENAASVLDAFRVKNYKGALAKDSAVMDNEFMSRLYALCRACAVSSATALTAGVLQDVLDAVVQGQGSEPTELDAALDDAIAGKVIPQLSGPKSGALALRDLITTWVARAGAGEDACMFPHALTALNDLLSTVDASSGHVYFRY